MRYDVRGGRDHAHHPQALGRATLNYSETNVRIGLTASTSSTYCNVVIAVLETILKKLEVQA